uniref:Cystinosin homolog n=1 Tax=Aceria tosichella TaxID=561515 RepID=A0A6G1SHQ8_9ACAR
MATFKRNQVGDPLVTYQGELKTRPRSCESPNKTIHVQRYSNNYFSLVTPPITTLLTCLFLMLTATVISGPQSVGSVIMPPPKLLFVPLHSGRDARPVQHLEAQGDDEPYRLTVNEYDGVSVPINSHSNITINLNKAIPETVTVRVSVNSGPNLIVFESQKDQMSINETLSNVAVNTTNGTSSEFLVTYDPNTFGDRVVRFQTTNFAGHAEIVCHVVKQPTNKSIEIDDKSAFTSVNIYRSWNMNVFIQIVGWIYFFAWSISFYFQVVLNYRRKSVVGLNFDFLALNLLGFACYTIYNSSLLFSYSVQQEYYKRYTYSRIPVEYNDLFFALHAFLISLVTVIQCFIYERGEQHVSLPAGIFSAIAPVLGLGLFVASLFHSVSILDVVLYLSYVKLVITTIKYSPQAYMNYKRKATTGWSIHNIILDFTGGSFSLLQMFLLAYNYDDWISIFGNFTKFGLGLVSMLFDIVFIVQHYVLYKSDRRSSLVNNSNENLENSSDSCPSPVISRSIISITQNQSQAAQTWNGSNLESDENSD